ncbi:SDR family NAD(P)-dependent oxidoreductase [Bacillus amyloliquefaciens]|nr:SDR family NAD(P)-dependent oxidoreductase [Bacillus velezensis]MCR4365695.1 SDR family NAD(P)-dependent oxidoreductase [Bacillus amyloliquefaciens]MCV3200380.1 SDR family NAD(P)-dependent oxidoreductase [Bacillus velezensis]MDP1501538.1 SDR family NAD(P)-dependent oxidoreductase [Bacillus velezensis]MDP1505397.1 SDR family NAD(P)-dependent oxidoreductase [Bacillus velezensis]
MRQVASNQNYQFTLTIKHTDYIVRDHRVHGTRIIPGVTFLDMIYRMALSKGLPIEELECQNILYLEPVATSDTFDREIRIRFQGLEQGWEIQAKSRKVKDDRILDESWDENMTCRLMQKFPESMSSINIDEIKHASAREADMEICYDYLKKVDIEHFEFMKSLGKVYASDHSVLAELSLSQIANQYTGYFQLHPTFLDASTIISILYQACPEYFTQGSPASRMKTYIPIHIESFRMKKRLEDRCYVYIEKQVQNHDSGDVIQVSYGLYDAYGEMIAYFTRLSVKHIRSKDLIENLKQTRLETEAASQPKDSLIRKDSIINRSESIETHLKELISGVSNIDLRDIRTDIGFYEQGLDSASLLAIVKELENKTGEQLYPTLLFEQKTIRELAAYIKENQRMSSYFLTRNQSAEKPDMKESKNENLSALITEGDIQQLIADIKGTAPETLSVVKGFYEQGLDSVTLMQAVKALEEKTGRELYPTLLFEYPTIQKLANYFAESGEKTSVEKDLPLHHGENHTALTYLTPHWRQKAAAWDPNCGNKKKRTCLLFQYDRELFHFMRENAENGFENTQIILVLSGNRFSYHGDGVYEIDHREEAHFDRLAADLKKRGQMPDNVVYGWPEGSFAGLEKISEQLSKGAYPLFFFSRALMRSKTEKKVVSLFLYPADHKYDQPLYASVHGAGQSIVLENPKLALKTIGISVSDKSSLTELTAEIIRVESTEAHPGETDLYYEGNVRWVRALREAEPAPNSDFSFKENGVYMITGGAGGLGLIFAEHIAAQTKANIILAGRSELTEDKKNKISRMKAGGSSVQYIRGDFSDSRDAERIIKTIKRQFGEINGVIHSAGVTHDALLIQKSKDEIQEVIAPKINGTVLLDSLLQTEPLDFFVMFSSSTSMYGNIGQTDYALANRFIDLFAEWREGMRRKKERSGVSVAIGWPLWEDGGMKVDKQTEKWMKQKIGMVPLSKTNGIKAFQDSLSLNASQLIVFEGDKEKLESALQDTFIEDESREIQINETADTRHEDIAIIGLSGKYPMAEDLPEFWENLKSGKDCITEIPPDRWNMDDFFSEDRDMKGKSYSKWGGFISGADQFDPLFFHISPREAELMDPQERLFLETAKHCFEDSGYPRNMLEKMKVGVFVGAMWGQYQLFEGEENGVAFSPASVYSSIANRVSYYFHLKGPSLALDTMCSSSLTSIHYACQSIHCGESDMALAGGVNLSIHPNKYKFLSMGQFLSSDGRCRSFGKDGSGYVPGEGVGAVLLKPLKKAIEDQDQIYGVIKGSAVNHGGKTSGYSIPNPDAQAEVISEALRKADIDPNTVNYIEAHGTGTSLGDPIEIQGLKDSYQLNHPCAIGSVKSNIGHLESAAGIAAVTKVLLQMKNKQLVPSLHSDIVNPFIDFDQVPFQVQRKAAEWNIPQNSNAVHPLRAGVSAFGAGGTNAHLILEAYEPPKAFDHQSGRVIFVLSAQDKQRLIKYAKVMADFLSENESKDNNHKLRLQDIAYTLQTGRDHMEERLAIVADSGRVIAEELSAYIRGEKSNFSHTGNTFESEVHNEMPHVCSDYTEAASKWVNGRKIDWETFEVNRNARRISIPGQPLIKQRYWIAEKGEALVSADMSKPGHPFLGSNTSDFNQFSFTKKITRNHPFALSLSEGNVSFFPYASLAEMAIVNAAAAFGQPVQTLTDLLWTESMNGITDIRELIITLTPERDFARFDIYANTKNENKVRLARGNAHIAKPESGMFPEALDIAEVKSKMTEHPAEAPFVIESAKNSDGMLSLHSLPDELYAKRENFTISPEALESAIQASAFFVSGETFPELIGMGAADVYHPLAQNFYVYTQKENRQNSRDVTCHMTFTDKNGSILAECRDVRFRYGHEKDTVQTDDELIRLLRQLETNDIDQKAVLKQLMGEE